MEGWERRKIRVSCARWWSNRRRLAARKASICFCFFYDFISVYCTEAENVRIVDRNNWLLHAVEREREMRRRCQDHDEEGAQTENSLSSSEVHVVPEEFCGSWTHNYRQMSCEESSYIDSTRWNSILISGTLTFIRRRNCLIKNLLRGL